jgi:hypothetical protein
MIHRLLSPVVTIMVLCAGFPAHAALVSRVAPFEGPLSEGFENIANVTQLTGLLGGNARFAGGADTVLTVQDGSYYNLWDQTAFEGIYFLGAAAGYGSPATVVIAFEFPVNRFGGQFGHRVRPGVDSSGETEFVFYDSRNRVIGRDRVFIGSDPGSVGAYWRFDRDVKRITYTCVHPMADALTVTMSPVQTKRLHRANKVK